MRFGISATSWIFPKNLRTRLRPVNVCAISSLALSNRRAGTTLRKAAIHRDHQDRRRSPIISLRLGRSPKSRPSDGIRQRYGRVRGLRTPASSALTSHLLEFHLSSGLFQLSLDLLGLVLGQLFLDGLGRALDQILGLLEAQTGERTHFLDHLDLLFTGGGEHDGELRFLFHWGGSGAAQSGSDGDG